MLQRAATALASIIDYTVPRDNSVAADFFHAYPRFASASKNFADDSAYRIGILKLAIPYAATGIILLIATLAANFYFFCKRGAVPGADDTHESNPSARDRTGRAFLLFSCFLNLAIVVCIGIAFGSAFSMRQAANSAHDALNAAKETVEEQLQVPAKLLLSFAAKAAVAKENSESLSEPARDVTYLLLNSEPSFHKIVKATNEVLQRTTSIDDQFKYLSLRFFLLTIFVLLVCVIGLLCTFALDASFPSSRSVRIVTFALLLLPLGATWTHTAISTSIAAASGDFCKSVTEYHHHIDKESKGERVAVPESNIFVKYGMQCPMWMPSANDFKRLNRFLGDSENLEDFADGFQSIMKDDNAASEWFPTKNWMQINLGIYERCATQLSLAGQISFHICGDHGMSAVSAIGQLWLCSFGLTLLFVVVVSLLTFGHPPSEFCSALELMYIYGAPQLISAFGDVRDVLKRHSTFRRMEMGKSVSAGSSSWNSSEDSELEKVAADYNLTRSSMSTDRQRRNAYTSHGLQNTRVKDTYWYSGESGTSSHSS